MMSRTIPQRERGETKRKRKERETREREERELSERRERERERRERERERRESREREKREKKEDETPAFYVPNSSTLFTVKGLTSLPSPSSSRGLSLPRLALEHSSCSRLFKPDIKFALKLYFFLRELIY